MYAKYFVVGCLWQEVKCHLPEIRMLTFATKNVAHTQSNISLLSKVRSSSIDSHSMSAAHTHTHIQTYSHTYISAQAFKDWSSLNGGIGNDSQKFMAAYS